jgi:fatty acid desaturase
LSGNTENTKRNRGTLPPPGYAQIVIWAAVMLMIALVAPTAWAWYISRRELAAAHEAQRWRLVRSAARVSAAIGTVILALGVVAFVLTGYDWLVLALIWSFGLLHIGLLARTLRRAQNRHESRISR